MQGPTAVSGSRSCSPLVRTARLVAGVPWLAVEYVDLDWSWVLAQARLMNLQNRVTSTSAASGARQSVAEELMPGIQKRVCDCP